ncbi:MAG: putative HNHc nuclease [Carnobacterium sp.]
MEYKSLVNAINGRNVALSVTSDLDIDKIRKNAVNGKIYATVSFYEKDTISDIQRNHFYALVHDAAEHTGNPEDAWESKLKFDFMNYAGLDEFPSVARYQMRKTVASQLLEYTINYLIDRDIPFRKQQFYLTTDSSKMLFALTMKRICWITGKRGEIHHATNLIGMGNSRKNHKHEESTFMCLSRESHIEAHSMGLDEFCELHHVKPVKLNKDQLKKLGVR